MNSIKRILVVFLAVLCMTLSATTVLAQEVNTEKGGDGTITIKNAAIGATYSVYKLFDASVGDNGAITYSGDIPSDLWFNIIFYKR